MAENLGQVDVVIRDATAGGGGGMTGPRGIPGGRGGGGGTNIIAPGGGMGAIKGFISKHPVGAALIAAAGVMTVAFKMASKTIRKWDQEMSQLQNRIAAFNADAVMGQLVLQLGNMRRTMGEAGIFGKTTRQLSEMKDRIADNVQPLKNMFQAFKLGILESFFRVVEAISIVLNKIVGWLLSIWETVGPGMAAYSRGSGWAMMALNPVGGLLNLIIAEGFDGVTKHLEDIKNQMAKDYDLQSVRDANQMMLSGMEHLTAGAWTYQHQKPTTQVKFGTGSVRIPKGRPSP
jgi:hypothetical protein